MLEEINYLFTLSTFYYNIITELLTYKKIPMYVPTSDRCKWINVSEPSYYSDPLIYFLGRRFTTIYKKKIKFAIILYSNIIMIILIKSISTYNFHNIIQY